jgi:Zn-dependent protease
MRRMAELQHVEPPPGGPARALTRPSPIFLGLLALCGAGAWMTWTGSGPVRLGVFLLVVAGWLVSLCLHEYAHAVVAYHGGDRSVAEKGYLSLDPRKYSDVLLSIVLPLAFVLLGGIGLPGGAVWIDRGRIPGRLRHTLVAAAGPLVNVVLAVALLVAVSRSSAVFGGHEAFWAALAYLGFLQVTASVLNLLPVPGLDGFGIVEPWLPREWARQAALVSPFGMLLVFGALWAPEVNGPFFDFVYWLVEAAGASPVLVQFGGELFRFWS